MKMKALEIIHMLEETMDLDEGTLTEESVLEEIEEWDSLSKLTLMATAKKDYQKNLTAKQVREFKTVKDICDYFV